MRNLCGEKKVGVLGLHFGFALEVQIYPKQGMDCEHLETTESDQSPFVGSSTSP